jgi:hypothetical protein
MQAAAEASICSGRQAGSFYVPAAAESVLQVLRIRCCRQLVVEELLLPVDLLVASTPGPATGVAAVVVVVHHWGS